VHLFFGAHAQPTGIKAGLQLILSRLKRTLQTHRVLLDPRADGGVIAYVFAPPSAAMTGFSPFVMVKPFFFMLQPRAQAHVLVHETTHLALAIRDQSVNDETAYGLLNVIDLAGQDETLAVRNADNWAQFVYGDNTQLL
jgi:hypothetical protein